MSKINTKILFEDLHDTVDVAYENGTDDCECGDDYCRCSTIVNARVEDVPCDRLAEEIAPKSLLVKYCVERILQHFKPLHDSSNWDIKVEGGYYGEELGEVKLNPEVADSLSRLLLSLNDASDNDIVETALQVEYGFVLSSLRDKTWTVERVLLSNVDLGNKNHAEDLDEKRVTSYRLNKKIVSALVLKIGDKYRVIDGYHRITAAKRDKEQAVWVVVGK